MNHRVCLPRSALFAIALLIASILSIIHLPIAAAQSIKPDPLLAQLEADFMIYWPKLFAFEEDYQLAHGGRYYQTLPAFTVVPADGKLETPDKLQAGPTDQAEKLSIVWSVAMLPSKLAYSFRIDVYDGPDGRGWVVTLSADIAGQLWERQINSGPEKWREQDWQEIKPQAP